jgi:hypothetical protein
MPAMRKKDGLPRKLRLLAMTEFVIKQLVVAKHFVLMDCHAIFNGSQ